MSRKYQWFFSGSWIDCTEENDRSLKAFVNEPSLVPVALKNSFGELFGNPMTGKMNFRIHGDTGGCSTRIRLSNLPDESPIYAYIGDSVRQIIPHGPGRVLFKDNKPSQTQQIVEIGTDLFMAENEKLYQEIDGVFEEINYVRTDLTIPQFKEISKTRFQWQFKGPFRWERMCKVISQLASELKEPDAKILLELFTHFDPNFDVTEHGPYQFNDYLISKGHETLAIHVMEQYNQFELDDWKCFDPMTNAFIERARDQGTPSVPINVRGHQYLLVFDSGGGASGQPPVIIRPSRYERILSSIEENVGRRNIEMLKEALEPLNIDMRGFLLRVLNDAESAIEEFVPQDHRPEIMAIVLDMANSENTTLTQIQHLMPTLLEKYKECDIRLSDEETLNPKRLNKDVCSTLMTGLRIPDNQKMFCRDFKHFLAYIRLTQSWSLPPGKETCDICHQDGLKVLGHCGSAKACLKCWVDSLAKTVNCPFCREEVKQGNLVIVTNTEKETKRVQKRKRERVFSSVDEILCEIHKDPMYEQIKTTDKEPMRKWFTVFMRTGLMKNGVLPRDLQAKKTFRRALRDLNIFK